MFDVKLPRGLHYEAHLMMKEPINNLRTLWGKVESVIIHVESNSFNESLNMARKIGYEVVAAINPATPVKKLEECLGKIDRALVMTVEPGKYGAPFVPEALEKVKYLRRLAPTLPIEVDGAMNPENARKAKEAGANIFASGSYLMKSNDLMSAIKALEAAVN
jgi:ribulose-phosphate 3-epimerase